MKNVKRDTVQSPNQICAHWAVLSLPLAPQESVSTSNCRASVPSSPTSSVRRRPQGQTGEANENTTGPKACLKSTSSGFLKFSPDFMVTWAILSICGPGRLHQRRSCWTWPPGKPRYGMSGAIASLGIGKLADKLLEDGQNLKEWSTSTDIWWILFYSGSIFLHSGWLRLGVVDFTEILSRWDEETEGGSAWDN